MRKLLGTTALITSLVFAGTVFASQDKITICHAAGQDGTTKFVTLELPYPAVYGNGGHFNENGTPRAGHEQDYLGPCKVESTPTPTPTAVPTATPIPTPTATPTPEPTSTPTPEPTSTPITDPNRPTITLPPSDTEG